MTSPPAPNPSLLHRLDDAVYSVEKAFVAASMLAMVSMVFLDVVARRLESQESKLAALLLALGRVVRLRPGAEGSAWVGKWVAPAFGAALLFGLIWFALSTVRRRRPENTGMAPALEPLLAAAGTALLFGFGWAMLHRPSNELYVGLWIVGGAAFLVPLRRRPMALGLLAIAVIGGALLLWFYVPEGYSWAKEVSMILLVWTGLIGASMAAHQGRNIDIDFGKKMFPVALRKPLTLLAQAVTFSFCALIVVLGAVYVFGATGLYRLNGHFPHTGIPDWIVAFAIPWVFGMIGLRTVLTARRIYGGDLTAKGSCPTAEPAAIGHGAPAKPGATDPTDPTGTVGEEPVS